MHPSPLRLRPSQSRPLTDASPGSARSMGLRLYWAANSRRPNIHTHAPFRTERQSFLRCWDMRLAISRKQRSGHAAALRTHTPQVRILSGAPRLYWLVRLTNSGGVQDRVLPSGGVHRRIGRHAMRAPLSPLHGSSAAIVQVTTVPRCTLVPPTGFALQPLLS